MKASLRHLIGALVYDWVPFELRMRGIGARNGRPEPWLQIRNRRETFIVVHENGDQKMVGSDCIKDFLGHVDPHTDRARRQTPCDCDRI